jgi:hypothetical protein
MLGGKQVGPLTRADLVARAGSGELGGRTYVWREGMDAWQRARDVSDLAFLFSGGASEPPAPAPQPLREEPAPQPQEPAKPSDEQVLEDGVPDDLFSAGSSAEQSGWAGETAGESSPGVAGPRAAPEPASTPASRPRTTPMFESSAPPRSRVPFAVVMVVLAGAAIGAWIFLERKAPAPQPVAAAAPATPDASVAEAEPSPPDAQVAAAPTPAPAPAPVETVAVPAAGLTPEQVRTKLDENKDALQGCIDEALKREPNLRVGRIHIATTIAPSGQVTAARIDKRSVDDAPLGACLKKATRKMVFPSFGGQAFDVDIPIVVTAGE